VGQLLRQRSLSSMIQHQPRSQRDRKDGDERSAYTNPGLRAGGEIGR
jgi:hypothetical protein